MKNNIYTLIAFDFGKRRIGVAIGNTLTCSARPLKIIDAKDKKNCFITIAEVIKTWSPDYLVVGLPIYPDGSKHPFSEQCSRFAKQLSLKFSLNVVLEDERWSSALAKVDGPDDAVAAAIILEGVLNASSHTT